MSNNRIRDDYDEVDLYDYLRVIWKWRWLIVIGIIVITLASIPVSYLLDKYESIGVLRISEGLKTETSTSKIEIILNPPEYKIYSAAFMDSQAFLDYIKMHKMLLGGEDMPYIEKKLGAESILKDYIKPQYAYAEEEIRSFKPKEQFISAVQLRWKGPSSDLARSVVNAMGLFVKDALEYKILEYYVTRAYNEAYIQVHELESKLADLRFHLEQGEKRLADLKKIAQQFPRNEQFSSREVVSVDKGGHLYLPPSTQIVAAQVAITDTKLGINDSERRLKINQVKLALFTILKEPLVKGRSGKLLERLVRIKEEFFQGKDLRKDEILIVRNDISADFAQFERWFAVVMQFVSGPTLPEKAKPPVTLVAAVAFVVGMFFFTLLAFFLEFIQRSRQRERIEGEAKGKK
jgi:hypothetical protein